MIYDDNGCGVNVKLFLFTALLRYGNPNLLTSKRDYFKQQIIIYDSQLRVEEKVQVIRRWFYFKLFKKIDNKYSKTNGPNYDISRLPFFFKA